MASHLFIACLLSSLGCGPQRVKETSARTEGPAYDAPIKRQISLGVHYDIALRQQGLDRALMTELVARASNELRKRFGVTLRLVEMEPLAFAVPETPAMEALEARLSQASEPAPELFLLLVASPKVQKTVSQASKSLYLRRVLLLAFGPDAKFGEGPSDFLARGQSQFFHAFGRIFGGLPSCLSTVMSPTRRPKPYRALQWLGANAAMVADHAVIDLRTLGGMPSQLPVELLKRVFEHFHTIAPGLSCQEHRAVARRVAFLDAAIQKKAILKTGLRSASLRDHVLEEALTALSQKQYKEAFTLCGALVEEDPELPGAARCAGQAAEALSKRERATFYYRIHLVAWPDDVEIVLSLARILGRRGDDSAALSLLRHAVTIARGKVGPRLNLGIALARMGRIDEARKAWEGVLETHPENVDALELLEASRRSNTIR